jgi:hypothetical protein
MKYIRQNINFLDRALFMVSRKLAKQSYYEDDKGYSIESTNGNTLPTAYDYIFMLFLLGKAQEVGKCKIEFSSMYAMMKEFGVSYGLKNLAHIKQSLWKWRRTSMEFRGGIFYNAEDKEYNTELLSFQVVNNIRIMENAIRITIDEDFYKESIAKFSKILDKLDKIKKLVTFPFALSLYLLLSKAFHGRDEWRIDIEKLFKKMGADYDSRYHSKAIEQLDKAIKKINDETLIYKLTDNNVVVFKI